MPQHGEHDVSGQPRANPAAGAKQQKRRRCPASADDEQPLRRLCETDEARPFVRGDGDDRRSSDDAPRRRRQQEQGRQAPAGISTSRRERCASSA